MVVQRIQSTDPAWAGRFLPAILPGGFLIGKSTCHVPRLRTLSRVYLPQLYPYLMAAARGGLLLIPKQQGNG